MPGRQRNIRRPKLMQKLNKTQTKRNASVARKTKTNTKTQKSNINKSNTSKSESNYRPKCGNITKVSKHIRHIAKTKTINKYDKMDPNANLKTASDCGLGSSSHRKQRSESIRSNGKLTISCTQKTESGGQIVGDDLVSEKMGAKVHIIPKTIWSQNNTNIRFNQTYITSHQIMSHHIKIKPHHIIIKPVMEPGG